MVEAADLDPKTLSTIEDRMWALNEEIDEVDDENDVTETVSASGACQYGRLAPMRLASATLPLTRGNAPRARRLP